LIKICILDYGLGNILSLRNSLKYLGFNSDYLSNLNNKFNFLIIPGVGSYSKASKLIKKKKYIDVINYCRKNNIFIFGICLGMQLLLSRGSEFGNNIGLNLIKGNVDIFPNKRSILPIIGWNKVLFRKNKKFNFLNKYDNKKFYFIHSYVANLKYNENILSTSKYDKVIYTSAILGNNMAGVQFHPEKSGEIGLNFLNDFIRNNS